MSLLRGKVDDTSPESAGEGVERIVRTTPTGEVPVVLTRDSANAGATIFQKESLVGTVVAVKASAGVMYGLQIVSSNGSAAFIQIFDLATGSVTLGTTEPGMQVRVAANTHVSVPIPAVGVEFGTAISIASTTAASGDTGSGAGIDVYIQYY
jgi:hypothetical protein